MEDEAKAFEAMFGKAGELVPVVDVADLKKMRAYRQESDARHQGEQYAIGMGVWEAIFGPGTDIPAVSYRYTMLWMLERWLRPMWTGGEFSEAALKAVANMELTRMAIGVPQNAMPLIDEFLGQVHKEAA